MASMPSALVKYTRSSRSHMQVFSSRASHTRHIYTRASHLHTRAGMWFHISIFDAHTAHAYEKYLTILRFFGVRSAEISESGSKVRRSSEHPPWPAAIPRARRLTRLFVSLLPRKFVRFGFLACVARFRGRFRAPWRWLTCFTEFRTPHDKPPETWILKRYLRFSFRVLRHHMSLIY